MIERPKLVRCAVTCMIGSLASLLPAEAQAQHANRIWVDAGGTHAVEAAMVELMNDSVRLLRIDGGEVTLSIDQLSEDDKRYITDQRSRAANANTLRSSPPEPPTIEPLPPLVLPRAARSADSGASLGLGGEVRVLNVESLPRKLPADRRPSTLAMKDATIPIEHVDFNNFISRPMPIMTLTDSGTRTTSLIASISGNIRLPGNLSRQQLIRFDTASEIYDVALQHDESIRLLDHHLASGQSLVLVGFNSLGDGGDLAVVTGWQDQVFAFSHRRKLDDAPSPGESTRLRLARWIDDQHVIAIVDQSLVLWNIVSGKQLYRIEGVNPRSVPSISGGGRYLALPHEGGVDLVSTKDGTSLGRIKVEKQIPGVAFSPRGNQLAITTTRRVRVWDLPAAALAGDVRARNSLGKGSPLWIDHDLILTDSGTLVSLFRGIPIWRYDLVGTERSSIGKRLAVFRKASGSQLSVMTLPHEGARKMMQRIDSSPVAIDPDRWQVPGRSSWSDSQWVDRDVQIGSLFNTRR